MMSIVSNTRVDIVARGVIKACLELDTTRPRRSRSSASRAPGRRRASRSSSSYGVEYADRTCRARGRRLRRGGQSPGMSILISTDTTFIVQGITGREAVNLTRECLDYGAGRRSSAASRRAAWAARSTACRSSTRSQQAVAHHGGADRRLLVTVPPAFTKDAVFEAIENGIKLIVIVTERIPRRDVAQMVELATAARRANHRPQLPRDHRPRRDQDGRHRRPGQGRRECLPARPRSA